MKTMVKLLLIAMLMSNIALAAPLPGSVDPGRVSQNYLPPSSSQSLAAPTMQAPKEEEKPVVSTDAQRITFTFNKMVLKGNHVYSTAELEKIYADKLKTKITVAELIQLVDDITNYYRNNGYILTQAILPPQRVVNGVVHVLIIEGYIDQVRIVGNPRGVRELLLAYGDNIAQARPLKVQNMEHYLYLANQLPGTHVKAVLEPSKTKIGASDLNLVVEQQLITGGLSYDNYGTRYLGPHQITGNIAFNSIFRSGDTTRFLYLRAAEAKELRYGDVAYSTPLGSKGLYLTLDANKSLTVPGFVLKELDTKGVAESYTIDLQYPIILSASQNLSVDANFSYLNSRNTQLGFLTYDDRIRPLEVGIAYNFSDRFRGYTTLGFQLARGFDILNASNDPNSFTSSHFGADGIYTEMNLQITRTQGLYDRFSLYLVANGQYSYDPLLAAEQFGFGGAYLGRGYDPAEILGDRGMSGSVELRLDTFPAKFFINSAQYYVFYDAGVIWNIEDVVDVPNKQSATSLGAGVRVGFTKYFSGNFMIAQPLTKQVATEEILGKGRWPRTFFSIVGNFP